MKVASHSRAAVSREDNNKRRQQQERVRSPVSKFLKGGLNGEAGGGY